MSASLRPGRLLLVAALVGGGGGAAFALFVKGRPLPPAPIEGPAVVVQTPPFNKVKPPPQADPLALEGLPAYPSARPAPLISEPTGVSGELKAAWFTTPDSPEDVLRFYERKLTEARLPVVSHRFSAMAGYAGYLDSDFETLHLVTVMRQGNQTVVFASRNDPMKMIERAGGAASGLPEPPNSQRKLSFDASEAGGARTYTLNASETTVAAVLDFYKRSLPQAGWRVASADESPEGARVEASRAHQSLSVWIKRKVSGDVAVSITIIRQA